MSTTTNPTGNLGVAPKIRGNTTKFDTKTMVTLSILSALAYLVMLLSKVLPNVSGFLEFDFKDMVIAIGGFVYGPMAAFTMTIVVSTLQSLFVGSSGFIGFVMNVIATGSFVGVASVIYWYRPNFKGAVIGLASGTLAMTALMLLWNYALTPAFMGIPRQSVVDMMLPVFLPFNLVKGGLNMGLTLTVYPKVMHALTKASLAVNPEEGREASKQKAFLVSLGVFTFFVVLALLLTGVI